MILRASGEKRRDDDDIVATRRQLARRSVRHATVAKDLRSTGGRRPNVAVRSVGGGQGGWATSGRAANRSNATHSSRPAVGRVTPARRGSRVELRISPCGEGAPALAGVCFDSLSACQSPKRGQPRVSLIRTRPCWRVAVAQARPQRVLVGSRCPHRIVEAG